MTIERKFLDALGIESFDALEAEALARAATGGIGAAGAPCSTVQAAASFRRDRLRQDRLDAVAESEALLGSDGLAEILGRPADLREALARLAAVIQELKERERVADRLAPLAQREHLRRKAAEARANYDEAQAFADAASATFTKLYRPPGSFEYVVGTHELNRRVVAQDTAASEAARDALGALTVAEARLERWSLENQDLAAALGREIADEARERCAS